MHRVRSPAVVVCLWVLLLTGLGVYAALRSYRSSLQTEFDGIAATRITTLQRNLDEKLLILQSMHSLYSIFDGKPQPQFRRFVQPFEHRLDGVRALQWVVPVRADERERFEQELRRQGIEDYQITERAPDGQMVRAAARDLYFPIYPLLPLDPHEASFGFDVASHAVRKNALDRAIANRRTAASGHIELLQENGSPGFMVVDPLFGRSDELLGLVMGIFHVNSIVEAVTSQFAPEALRIDIDDADDDSPLPIYSDDLHPLAAATWWQRTFTPHTHTSPLMVADRHWLIDVSASPGYLDRRPPLGAMLVLGSGLLLALVLAIYLTMRSRHEERLHAAENQRIALENQLLRSQRLEAIGQLVGGIAHDFKNLLHSIVGNVELLGYELTEVKPQIRHHLLHIERAAHRGNGLIQKMLSFSRNERTEPSPQHLPPLVEGTVAMLRPLIPANISLKVAIEKGLPRVVIDPTGFDQILVNLCINARDAIDGTGHIHVNLGLNPMPQQRTCLSCKQPFAGEFVVLSLSDSGSGIPHDVMTHMFDPFYTTKGPGKGTGLGLAIIHNIVHGSGGHILIDTETGLGTTFHILFPIEQQAAALRIA
ncbi:MAG TPA: CHASE domain-containing protein [Candidatus Acidoferrum sp.]|nr:CHASE domain-containing protein [Candidatus Acidoferrum sp.]